MLSEYEELYPALGEILLSWQKRESIYSVPTLGRRPGDELELGGLGPEPRAVVEPERGPKAEMSEVLGDRPDRFLLRDDDDG